MKHSQPRYCSSPDQLQAQIKKQHDIDIALTDTDVICLSCYKTFYRILENSLSLDSNLEELIHSLEAELTSTQPASIDECVDQSMLNATLAIAKSLLKIEAVLLSDAHDSLAHSLTELSQPSQNTNAVTVSKRALHKHLISSLQEHLECKTVEQSVGIILYRKGGDIMKSLSRVLANQRRMRLTVNPTTDTNSTPTTDSDNNMLHTVCDLVNDRVHNAIDKILQQDKNHPVDLSTINFEQEMANTDPTVWQMLRLLTRTREERKKPSKSLLQESPSTLRSQCLFYIMCIMFFITDNRCNIPLHTLLTDVVYSHGGTTELVRVMNRVGMISSEDTHVRYVDNIVRHSDKAQDVDPSQTVVATLDNLDFLQSNAAVYCGDQHRSWHGTTVQILQPKPPSHVNTVRVSTATSLSLPPSEKKERRSRNAKERSEGEGNAISSLPLLEQTVDCQTSEPISLVIEDKTMKDFLVSDDEKGRLNEFTQQAFDYVTDRVQTRATVGLQEYLRQAKGVNI